MTNGIPDLDEWGEERQQQFINDVLKAMDELREKMLVEQIVGLIDKAGNC